MTKSIQYLFFCLLLALLATSPAHGDCSRAKELDESASRIENGEARVAAYREIVALCDNFNYLYKLGRSLQDLGNHAEAKEYFLQARTRVGDKRAEGLLHGRLAEVHLALGEVPEAVAAADAAASLTRPEVPEWIVDVRRQADLRQADMPVTAEAVARGFSASRSIEVRPVVQVYVLFETDRDRLTAEGSAQVAELGKALNALPAGESIRLIGHTDIRGTDEYNLDLSERRARTVASAVIAGFPALAGRIHAEGHGEREPRYPGTSEEDHRLNRRVEVVLED